MLVVTVIIVSIFITCVKYFPSILHATLSSGQKIFSTKNSGNQFLINDTYTGVFLDNNDVYFGKIIKRDSSFVALDNAFFLRVTQVPQKGKDGKTANVPSLNLIKVGTEIHKPTGKVEIQVSHILFMEDLDPTSGVVRLIRNYKAPAIDQTQVQTKAEGDSPK